MVKLIAKIFIFFDKVKNFFIKKYQIKMFKSVGNKIYIGKNSVFKCENIFIGENVYFGDNTLISSPHGKVYIGNDVMFGPNVSIHGGNHIYNVVGLTMKNINKNDLSDGIVRIENDVWIGANSVILKNVTIGEGAIVGAGSIVTKNIEPYTIVAGNPAKFIKYRFSKQELSEHKELLLKK